MSDNIFPNSCNSYKLSAILFWCLAEFEKMADKMSGNSTFDLENSDINLPINKSVTRDLVIKLVHPPGVSIYSRDTEKAL